jgi:opacity protein-like surface antigen
MRWLVLPVALCAVSPAAFAMDPSLRGFYIGGAIGNATVEFEDDWTGDTFDADDTGYKIIVGYRIIDWVAVEVNYSDYGAPVDRFLGRDVEMSFNGTSISALGMLPLGKFDLFGRLGISRLEGDLKVVGFRGSFSNEETEPMIGIGAQFRPTQNLAIRLEVEGVLLDASNDDDDDDDFWNDDFDNDDDGDWVDMLSLGVTYKF